MTGTEHVIPLSKTEYQDYHNVGVDNKLIFLSHSYFHKNNKINFSNAMRALLDNVTLLHCSTLTREYMHSLNVHGLSENNLLSSHFRNKFATLVMILPGLYLLFLSKFSIYETMTVMSNAGTTLLCHGFW